MGTLDIKGIEASDSAPQGNRRVSERSTGETHVSFTHFLKEFKSLILILESLLLGLIFLFVVDADNAEVMHTSATFGAYLAFLPILVGTFALFRKAFSNSFLFTYLNLIEQIRRLLLELVLIVCLVIWMMIALDLEYLSGWGMAAFAIVLPLTLIPCRIFLVWWYFGRANSQKMQLNVLIIGSGRRAHFLADRLLHTSERTVSIVGFVDPVGKSVGQRESDSIIGGVDQISDILRDNVIDEVVVAVPRTLLGSVEEIYYACEEEGVHLQFMADIYDFEAARISLNIVDEIPLLRFEPVAHPVATLRAKRFMDLTLTLLILPFVIPIFLITAIAIKIDSPGPVFFEQERVGLHKRRFKMLKFRSMVSNAEEKMKEIEHLNEADGPNFKIQNDPRITRAGRFIRKVSIDELPQLLNVLFGEMSLVGPRPMSIRDVELFDKGIQRKRFSIKPGITCLWQVSGRSNLSFEDWLKLDLKYIKELSIWLDLKILFLTIPAVVNGRGAA